MMQSGPSKKIFQKKSYLDKDLNSCFQAILEIASRLGLERVGWIVTDLDPDKDGLVKNVRNGESHFVSAEECIIAGRLQAAHPNKCRLAPSGEYGSKFVTIIVTGKDDGQIDFRGYQVSNQVTIMRLTSLRQPKIISDAPFTGIFASYRRGGYKTGNMCGYKTGIMCGYKTNHSKKKVRE